MGEPALDTGQKTTVTVSVTKPGGEPAANDHITFNLASVQGQMATCGKLSAYRGNTNPAGELKITYTAVAESTLCNIIAVEARTGQHGSTTMYLGKLKHVCPMIFYTGPKTLTPDKQTSLAAAVMNPADAIPDSVITVTLTGASLAASQVHLSYRVQGAKKWTTVLLSGDTKNRGMITGNLQFSPSTFPMMSTQHDQFQITVTGHATSGSQLNFKVDLAQVNGASGCGNTMYTKPLTVTMK